TGAAIVALSVMATVAHVWSRHRDRPELTRPATLLAALVAVQIALGALNVLSRLDVWINSVHVVVGALVLTTSLVLTLRAWREIFAPGVLKPDTTVIPRHVSDTVVGSVLFQADCGTRA